MIIIKIIILHIVLCLATTSISASSLMQSGSNDIIINISDKDSSNTKNAILCDLLNNKESLCVKYDDNPVTIDVSKEIKNRDIIELELSNNCESNNDKAILQVRAFNHSSSAYFNISSWKLLKRGIEYVIINI